MIRYTRDEVYIVASRTGVFVAPDRRKPFKPTDFVPAGVEHRFEDFSGDFAMRALFYGPGGNKNLALVRDRHSGAKCIGAV